MLDLPPRPDGAAGGEQIARELRGLDLVAREARIFAEISRGNVPAWMRELDPVEVEREIAGRTHKATFWVTPDYLAVGSDTDFFLIPLTSPTAQRIADLAHASLPTPTMVDAVWASARVRLAPIRIPPDEFLTSLRYFVRHDRLVQAQRWLRRVQPGTFVAGHKKDVVLSAALDADSGTAAIYGWHRTDGEPIQPLYAGLSDDWVGYNHGVRLVAREILVDGLRRDLLEVLQDPKLAPLLNEDGAIGKLRYSILNER